LATPICTVDLAAPLVPLEFAAHQHQSLLLFRWRNRFVGSAILPIVDGRIDPPAIEHALAGATPAAAIAWMNEILEYEDRDVVEPLRWTASVAICTRERPEDLARTLDALTASTRTAEILVVDNAPDTDATRQVVNHYAAVRYVVEPRRGLNVARNRALREAKGAIVAFTDDDAMPDANWLDALLRNFSDPSVLCATGLTLPYELETEAQEQFERHSPFSRGFRRRVFDGQHDSPVLVAKIGAGANMAVRRDLVAKVGPFDERLDAGTPTRSGGDHEMFARILAGGYRIVYDPAAVSWHRHRRTHRELLDTVYGYGVGVYAMWTKLLLQRELGVLKQAWTWFRVEQLPVLLGRGRDIHSVLVREQLRGCLHGPRAWLQSRRMATTKGENVR